MSQKKSMKTSEQVDQVATQVEAWSKEDQLQKGQEWYLVNSKWWNSVLFPRAIQQDEQDDDMEGTDPESSGSPPGTNSDTGQAIYNAPLVDTLASSTELESVVLKPRMAEHQHFEVVSERVWNLLKHTFGADWSIPRKVITHGPMQKLRVEIYPTLFQVHVWYNGLDGPIALENAATKQPPVVVSVSSSASLAHVQDKVWKGLASRSHEFFPDVSSDRTTNDIRLCIQSDQNQWISLDQAATNCQTKDNTSTTSSKDLENVYLSDLELQDREYLDGSDRYHALLIEGKYKSTDTRSDWRHSRFFTDISANEWRFELKEDQVIDAMDTDRHWYDSRILQVDGSRVKVHYRGWTPKWDEWLDRLSPRLAPLHSRLRNWRHFRIGDKLQVGFKTPGRIVPEWRDAEVIASEAETSENEDGTTVSGRVQCLMDNGVKVWRDVQDELLALPSTHRAANTTKQVSTANPRPNAVRQEFGQSKPTYRGVVGLQNLGNTCFLNSMLQCLFSTHVLKDYFLATQPDGSHLYLQDVNVDNPLGMQGKIAKEFGALMSKVWSDTFSTIAPTKLKGVIGQYAPQFAGYQQQDSQEVMNFLLDGLHEDLNRVRAKPYTEAEEINGRDEVTFARDEWDRFRQRNDSVVVDHCMGQLRSHVVCANDACRHESLTFDPFMSLSLPIPTDEQESSTSVRVQLFWSDGRVPTRYGVQLDKMKPTLRDVKTRVSQLSCVPFSHILFVEVTSGGDIRRAHNDRVAVEDLEEDVLHAYELDAPLVDYALSSKDLKANNLASLSLRNGVKEDKPRRLVRVMHQAPTASPIDNREDGNQNDLYSSKQRRVEAQLANAPLLVSLEEGISKADVHARVWTVAQRLVNDQASTYGVDEGRTLPYRLHVAATDGSRMLLNDLPRSDEAFDVDEWEENEFCFLLEWSRHGYLDGYSVESAERVELHESMKGLTISSTTKKADPTLMDCLGKFTEREQLGDSDTWYCPKCHQHVQAYKKFDMYSLPKVLVLHLKRFRYAQNMFALHRDKITTLVDFPLEELDLAPMVVGPQKETPQLYDLYAVSEHIGGLGGGHYTAVTKNPELQEWFSYNDSHTSKTTADKAVSARAYVLFYVRRD